MPMYPEDWGRFPEDFLQALIDAAHSLEKWKLPESIWKYQDITRVINFLVDAQYIMTGGDVYVEESGQLFPMPDNWHVAYLGEKPLREQTEMERRSLLEASREQSLTYVENYWNRNGDKYYDSIVFTDADPHQINHRRLRGW